MTASEDCYNIIKKFESLHDGDLKLIGLQPKECPAGYWTIGWGHVVTYKGRMLRGKDDKELAYSLYMALTIDQAESLLKSDVAGVTIDINRLKLDVNQKQFDALVSLCFNIGIGNFQDSTLVARIRAKSDVARIRDAFMMWRFATVKGVKTELKGLKLRRESEADLFFKQN